MYGPGESPRQPMPPGYGGGPPQQPGYGAGHPQGQPPGGPGYGQQPPGYGGAPAGQRPTATREQPQQYQPQQHQPQQAGARLSAGIGGRLLVIAAAVVLAVTGGINAVSGPLGYLNDVNVGVLILGGNELFLSVAQTVLGLALLVSGALLLTGRRFPWGLALVSAGVFAVYESYFIVRGSVIHYVGLFLAIVVFALLHQNAVRRHCKIGPPAR